MQRHHKKKKPAECPCGTDNQHKEDGNYQATYDGLQKLVTVSKEAAGAGEFQPAYSTWVAQLVAVGPTFGATGYKDLNARLEAMMRQEADWQADGYRRGDKKAGEVHGGRRGLVQEAQHQIARAAENFATLKKYEAEQEKKKRAKEKEKAAAKAPKEKAAAKAPKEKAAAKAHKPGKPSEMTEAAVIEAGARRGISTVNAMIPGAVVALYGVKGFDWGDVPRSNGMHRIDGIPENLAGEYYSALHDASRKRAGEIKASLPSAKPAR